MAAAVCCPSWSTAFETQSAAACCACAKQQPETSRCKPSPAAGPLPRAPQLQQSGCHHCSWEELTGSTCRPRPWRQLRRGPHWAPRTGRAQGSGGRTGPLMRQGSGLLDSTSSPAAYTHRTCQAYVHCKYSMHLYCLYVRSHGIQTCTVGTGESASDAHAAVTSLTYLRSTKITSGQAAATKHQPKHE